MLLRLITGQRAFDLARLDKDEDVMLLAWAKGLILEERVDTVVDPDLDNNYVEVEVKKLTQLALLCTQDSPARRPEMSEVVRMLDGDDFLLAERWEQCQIILEEVHRGTLPTVHDEYQESIELSSPR